MKKEEINKAIAEACGWKWKPKGDKYGPLCHPWELPDKTRHPGRDWCNDLNAMHEAEKMLTEDQYQNYFVYLVELAVGGKPMTMRQGIFAAHKATALQRAEAFLRTLGKWRES